MKKAMMILIAMFLLTALHAQDEEQISTQAFESPVSERAARKTKRQLYRKLADRHMPSARLSSIDIVLNQEDWDDLESDSHETPVIGLTKNIGMRVELGDALGFRSKIPFDASIGVARHYGDRMVWNALVSSEGARGVRLYFKEFNLPEGAQVYLYSELGQAFGPYVGMGPNGKGAFWSDTVFAEEVWVQVEAAPDVDPDSLAFTIEQVAHFSEGFRIGASYIDHAHNKYCPGVDGLTSCFENARCYNSSGVVQDLMDAVAWITYKKDSNGKWYGCTGSLINSSGSTSNFPWFLTAAHCVDSSTEADSMEAYFDYKTSSCSSLTSKCGSAYDDAKKVSGATLYATNNASNADYSLLKLSKFPNGSYIKLGWSAGDYTDNDGETLYRVSHPNHYPQSYAEHVVDTSLSTCSGNTRPTYIYTRHTLGYTEGGSSGSPLVNSSSQIVGTDRGRCSDNTCVDSMAVRDGSFRYQFYDKLRPYIKPTDIHIENVTVTEEAVGSNYRASVRVQVLDQRDVPVAGAFVQMMITGPVPFPAMGGTDSDGWATLYGPSYPTSSTWTACPLMIIHPWLVWDPSEDVESCDSN